MLLGTLRGKKSLLAVFIALFLSFLALTITELGGDFHFHIIGGYLGILTALIAWYAATRSSELVAVPVAATVNPIPLGLSAFALTAFVASIANAGLFFNATMIGLAIFYGGLIQILAGVLALRTRNAFGATAFCTYGAFWLVFYVAIWQHLILSDAAVGYFLLVWTLLTVPVFIVALKTDMAFIVVSVVAFLTFLVLAIGALGGGSTFTVIGGWLGILLAIVAWYTALAGILNSGEGAFRLPIWPRA